jgi:dTMP kinase
LICICGIDGSGKATQTALLESRAVSEGWQVETVSFPRYGEGFFAGVIERYLRGEFAESAGDVSPYLASLAYAGDRWEAAPRLRSWLGDGRLVLCNRYVPANLAHQGAKIADAGERAGFYDWDEEMEYGVYGIPRPDLQVLLDIPAEVSAELVRRRDRANGREAGHDIHERDLPYLARTAAAYRELARRRPDGWAVVACTEGGSLQPPDAIAHLVWEAVRPVLYNQ